MHLHKLCAFIKLNLLAFAIQCHLIKQIVIKSNFYFLFISDDENDHKKRKTICKQIIATWITTGFFSKMS